MRELFDLLNQKEKRILEVFSILMLAAIFFLFFIAIREKNVYFSSVESFSSKEREYQELNRLKKEKESEWLNWEKAREDVEELRKKYFFQESEGINRLRLSLQQIFDESNIYGSNIRYSYNAFERENIGKVSVSFDLVGSYFSLKKFIHSVEKLQKFIFIEKIDFLETPAQGGPLRLKITLAGYYAS